MSRRVRLIVKAAVPGRLQPALLSAYLAMWRPFVHGDRVNCPCCGRSFRSFPRYRIGPTVERICPGCGALGRHRLLMLYLLRRTDLLSASHRVLHVAPESEIQRRLRELPALDYTSVDLDSPLAMEHRDVTDLGFPSGRFDVILCVHVLEHVPDDRAAMRELFRVLQPGGWGVIEVPLAMRSERTVEDPSVTSPRERERRFGQRDHVRQYGRDYLDRLAEAGFAVELDPFPMEIDEATREQYGLRAHSRGLVVCRRPA